MNFKNPIEKVPLYGGRVALIFNAATHRYRAIEEDGRIIDPVPGVTSVLSVLARPALVNWAASQAAEYVAENLQPGVPLDEVEIRELADAARQAYRRSQKRAATVGTIVHEWIERYVRGRIGGRRLRVALPENPQARSSVEAFLGWVEAHRVRFHESERRLYSRQFAYAGTADLIAEVDGRLTIVDIKTSKGVYPEYQLQIAAYWHAWEEEMTFVAELDGIEPVALKRGLVLRVDKATAAFEVAEVIPDRKAFEQAFKVFQALMEVYRWRME